MTVKTIKISDLLPDQHNANQGSERGTYLLDKSVEQFGAGRSILLDKNNGVIAGNGALQALADAGYTEFLVIETDGKQAVAVKRTDMDLSDPDTHARELAIADNRTSNMMEWNVDELIATMESGVDLSDWFMPFEIDEMLQSQEDYSDIESKMDSMQAPRQSQTARLVLSIADIEEFETALASTGFKNRSEAFMEIVRVYQNAQG